MSNHFPSIFQKNDAPTARGKYLSRVFGIFSEEIVRLWASDPRSPYEGLGRPTIRKLGERAGSTLDFTLRHKITDKVYVAEMKCEIEYQKYRYLVLTDAKQLDHHSKPAFFAFLDAARRSQDQQTFVNGQEIQTHGAILIWGATTPDGRQAVIDAKGFFDILTVADMVGDLTLWSSEPYRQLVEQRRAWANEMFDGLLQAPT